MSFNVLVIALAVAQTDASALTERQSRDLQTACLAFEHGSPLLVVQRLAPIAGKEELLPAVEQTLQRRELPRAGRVLALSRLELARQGRNSQVPRPAKGEILLLLPAIKEYLQEGLDGIAARPVMRDVLPLAETLKGFQQTFWQLDVVEGQLADVEGAAKYLRTLTRNVPKADLAQLDGEIRQMVANDDVGGLLDSVETIRKGLAERRVELAIERLGMALRILEEPRITPQHLLAAATSKEDGQLATTFLKKNRDPRRPALREKGLLKRVSADAAKAGKLAGNLAAKAKLLQDGLRWWQRGRYGSGPEVMGLVKSQQAMRTPEGRFHVFMPEETPVPSDPFAKKNRTRYPYPQYQRRHLYTWAWGNRYVHEGGWTHDNKIYTDVQTRTETRRSRCNRTYTYTVEVPVSWTTIRDRGAYTYREVVENDNENLLRLVGFLEYAMALSHFDRLLSLASAEELAAMGELVASQDQYTVYVNLSRNFPHAATTSFRETPQQIGDTFERRGLAWVIALARLEIGAMLAGYSERPNPFQRARPSKYELDAYEELLVDSMRLHVWGLDADPLSDPRALRQAARNNSQLGLLYERRLRVVLRLIEAVRQWAGARATQAQLAELRQSEKRFGELFRIIRNDILRLGDSAGASREVSKFGRGDDGKVKKID